MKPTLYFASVDDTYCKPLEDHLHDAKIEGLTEITLLEAVPDTEKDSIWCTYLGEVEQRNECKKSFCSYYSSKSGKGICEHRGNLYWPGEEITFQVPQESVLNTPTS